MKCVVCGARSGIDDTCDPMCARAKRFGRTRGKQTELETRATWQRPIVVDSLTVSPGPSFKQNHEDFLEEYRPYMEDWPIS